MMIDEKKNFSCGKRLRQLRHMYSLSQEELALSANITPAYLGLIEREERNPTVKTIEKLCDAMGISLCEFFNTEENGSYQDGRAASDSIYVMLKDKDEEFRQTVMQIIKLMTKL